jgi:hypothetical protein
MLTGAIYNTSTNTILRPIITDVYSAKKYRKPPTVIGSCQHLTLLAEASFMPSHFSMASCNCILAKVHCILPTTLKFQTADKCNICFLRDWDILFNIELKHVKLRSSYRIEWVVSL